MGHNEASVCSSFDTKTHRRTIKMHPQPEVCSNPMRSPLGLAVRIIAWVLRRPLAAAAVLSAGAAACAAIFFGAPVRAQDTAMSAAQSTPIYSAAQLDQMLAPIALYPDDLLGQILMAATYPLEVVQADRWLQIPANASLRGSDLAQALQQQPWDASVKALVAFPQILGVMDNNLQWTEELGEAFLVQQAEVMDHVQELRSRAQAARTLNSSAQQNVSTNDQAIEIAPPGADTLFVPIYDPNVAYGEWPYPDYLPYYFDVPGYPLGSFIALAIIAPLWGWNHWDWNHHRLNIGAAPGFGASGPALPLHPGPWRHDPQRRAGVPYRSGSAQARFGNATELRSARENFRGYSPSPASPAPANVPELRTGEPAPVLRAPSGTPQPARIQEPRYSTGIERPAPPALESFGGGAQVRVQEQRGAGSRMSVAPSGGARGVRR